MARRPDAVIYDLDGTITSAVHRSVQLDQTNDWSAFHGRMVLDQPIENRLRGLRGHRRKGRKVILLSMRPERFRKHTEAWLRAHDVPFDELYLRPETDYRRGTDVKLAIYLEKIAPRFNVLEAYDDTPAVLDMWRVVGVPAHAVTDPGLPPYEGLPARDPKYPRGRVGPGGIGRVGARVYVPPHTRIMNGKVVNVDGYMRTLSSVERLRDKVSLGRQG
jgi:hypothetical protein